MIYHFPMEFFHKNSYFSFHMKKTSVAMGWEFVQNKFILSVS